MAVGNEMHWSKTWPTFTDFLMDYIKRVLGPEWGNAELLKPIDERHQVMRWYDAMCRFQRQLARGPDGFFDFVPNGAMRAFTLLSYDLYILRHHSALQASIISRLKHKDQFQGARHELMATATCIRAGFDISFEDETDSETKHTEFKAVHKTTGQKIAVEAKSRHRPGVLGFTGTIDSVGDIRARIDRLLRDAFSKPVAEPYVIFFDLNLPPFSVSFSHGPVFDEITESVYRVARESGDLDPFNLIVFTSQPDHYCLDNSPYPPGIIFSVLSPKPRFPATYQSSIIAIHDAANQYGEIPITFEEAS